MTNALARRELCQLLGPAAGDEALLESGFILDYCLGCRPGERPEVPEDVLAKARTLAARRLTGEPLQYILGEWEFMGLRMLTGPGVLIPRPETELLCELALRERPADRPVLDLCCGTGCLGIALAKLGGAAVTLSDISEEALSYARKNAALHGANVRIVCGDLFGAVKDSAFSVIVCNPPYLSAADMAARQKELYFEPENALFGGEDGLEFYRRLSEEADAHLLPGGVLLMEIGCTQGEAVRALFPGSEIYKDLSGLDRAVVYREA